MIRPGVVLFGEMLPEKPLRKAVELATMADVILCIGSSLEVQPAAGLPVMTKQAGGTIAIFTQGPTPVDSMADFRFDGDVVDELEALLAAIDAA
jgi:NAD-dependent deacetylase